MFVDLLFPCVCEHDVYVVRVNGLRARDNFMEPLLFYTFK